MENYDWYIYNPAVEIASHLKPENEDKSLLFLIRSNLLRAATGSARKVISYIQNTEEIKRFEIDGENLLLNGILFKIYINSECEFRSDDFIERYIDEVLTTKRL